MLSYISAQGQYFDQSGHEQSVQEACSPEMEALLDAQRLWGC